MVRTSLEHHNGRSHQGLGLFTPPLCSMATLHKSPSVATGARRALRATHSTTSMACAPSRRPSFAPPLLRSLLHRNLAQCAGKMLTHSDERRDHALNSQYLCQSESPLVLTSNLGLSARRLSSALTGQAHARSVLIESQLLRPSLALEGLDEPLP
jgi:hypothetical protein